jgi:nucleoside-diphosphate-sugar epimerase
MRANDGRAIPNFVTQALEGNPITVYGDGKQTRSFCFVSDMVEGLKRFMFTEGVSGEVINMGNPDEYPIMDVARKIKALTGSGSGIVFSDLPRDDPARRRPDISRAREKLGWEPTVPFEEGLEKTVEWFRKE